MKKFLLLLQNMVRADLFYYNSIFPTGGGGEIRTHGTLTSTLALQASTLNHSVTPPVLFGVKTHDLFWQT